jgi:hypothetical protein
MTKYKKDLKERLREILELRAQFDNLGFSKDHPTIIEFKNDCNSYIRNEITCSKTLPLKEYGYKMEYNFTLTKHPCTVNLKKIT